MKSVTKIVLLLIVSAMTFVSCDPAKEFKEELSTLDSCLVEIDSLETLLDGIEFDSLVLMFEKVEENERSIKLLYNVDTLDEKLGQAMNECKQIRKSLDATVGLEMAYGEELNAVKHQFLDLKDDILNGIFDAEQVKEYLGIEKEALYIVSVTVLDFYEMQKREKLRFYMFVPEIDVYIDKLRSEIIE